MCCMLLVIISRFIRAKRLYGQSSPWLNGLSLLGMQPWHSSTVSMTLKRSVITVLPSKVTFLKSKNDGDGVHDHVQMKGKILIGSMHFFNTKQQPPASHPANQFFLHSTAHISLTTWFSTSCCMCTHTALKNPFWVYFFHDILPCKEISKLTTETAKLTIETLNKSSIFNNIDIGW